ncbi:hypothetical protein RclHR1_01150010 [Rhizophagus clarus]|uniref:Uncharacterized protein n=1 Tax=Rhizophagus clarus TaxID=94130 RepID=A0A2Z6QXC1_9GLOM|nr:hypothetical protein RclHR1_01150010 [Rhizophagus clarus]
MFSLKFLIIREGRFFMKRQTFIIIYFSGFLFFIHTSSTSSPFTRFFIVLYRKAGFQFFVTLHGKADFDFTEGGS